MKALAAVNGAVHARLVERALHRGKRLSVDQRADQGAVVVERVADRHLAPDLDEARHKRVIDAVVHEQAAKGGAALPGGAGGGEHDAAQRQVQVRARGDDGRVVAAQLQQDAAKALSHLRADLPSHAG